MSVPTAEGRLQLPLGVRDVLFGEAETLRTLENRIAGLFMRAGCREVRPPTLELSETIAPVVADETSLYKLIDRSGRVLALRPDLTASVARLVATHFAAEPELRLWYAGQVFRYEQAQGRPHELRQAGIEWFGDGSAAADAAVIALAGAALAETAAAPYQIALGHTAVLDALWAGCGLDSADRGTLQHALMRQDYVAYETQVAGLGLASDLSELLCDIVLRPGQDLATLAERFDTYGRFPQAVAGVRRLEEVVAEVRRRSPELAPHLVIDFGLVRDFAYYTGIVLEGFADGVPQPVLTGGRYDDLLAEYGAPRPALGFALDLSALAASAANATSAAKATGQGVQA